jgi:hypothetical protein
MTSDKKFNMSGIVENRENRDMDWMLKKARELGFSEVEIKKLKNTYLSKEKTGDNQYQ